MDEQRQTIGLNALRRKKALQDMQVSTPKFIPRAVSPHIRQINCDRDDRFSGIVRKSIVNATASCNE
jgi:hypothetical protein